MNTLLYSSYNEDSYINHIEFMLSVIGIASLFALHMKHWHSRRIFVHDDYYSFNPRFHLSQHCYVISFFGTPLPASTRYFQTLSGVPVIDIERLLEHELGSRLAHYAQLHHRDEIYQVECEILKRVYKEQPSLIVLRPSTLRYRKNRDFLQGKNGLVLKQSADILSEQLQVIHSEDRRERFWDLDLTLPLSEQQLIAEMIVWQRYLPSHWQRLDFAKVSALEIGQQLITECQQL